MSEVRFSRRPEASGNDKYGNTCLIIDDIESEKICTTSALGEPFLVGNEIVFQFHKRTARKVEISFPDETPAAIAELKIKIFNGTCDTVTITVSQDLYFFNY